MGYWLWYVTSGDSHDAFGMEVNSLLPTSMNSWGCEQLKARFGDGPAPYGCVAGDYVSWR
jgi:hypothetical protein